MRASVLLAPALFAVAGTAARGRPSKPTVTYAREPRMTRAQFDTWHTAFDRLVACAGMVEEMLRPYLGAVLRSPEARDRFCAPLTAPG
jgi:hypothetical protein